ncbi:Type II secretion system protein D precursor [Planctomycetes bacterium Pla163]|uniref:Type II secretion system protein D n=1 Tax=Rohdeia mirabilis TaxID=2528008 RepID=A0A518D364_9BACT|nr:Type II secretion system protein D precursor [Planctomycetes bacterium Pla163]
MVHVHTPHRVPSPGPRRSSRALAWLLVAAGLVGGCAAPAPSEGEGRTGSLAELRELLEEGTSTAVTGEVVESDPEQVGPVQDLRPVEPSPFGESIPAWGVPGPGQNDAGTRGLPAPMARAARAVDDTGPIDPLEGFSENPYLRFGERIVVRRDGRITKPYPLQLGRGKRLLQLMAQIGGFPIVYQIIGEGDNPVPPLEDPPGPEVAQILLLEDWDFEQYSSFQPQLLPAPSDAKSIKIADWFVVTAGEELLLEIEDFIDLFVGSVPQIEIQASIVEVITRDEIDYGVRGVGVDGSVVADFPDGTLVDFFSYAVPNTADANEAVLSLGAITDGVRIDALLEVIQTWENVNITTRPKIAVREGGVAEVINTRDVPFISFSGFNSANGNFNASLTFKPVGVQLFAAPRVLGTDTLSLNLYIEASEQVGTAISFFDGDGNEVRSPLIARRQARTVVYLKPGQAVVIGGLETVREVNQERKVPILGDLPLIGLLFRSERRVKERTNVLFFIKPRILQGTDFMSDL